MILVILFFSVSVTVTAQLFVSAAARADRSEDLSAAVFQAQNVAEQIRGISSPDEVPQMLLAAARTDKDGQPVYRLTYDHDWNPTAGTPSYALDVSLAKTPSDGGTLVSADVEVFRYQSGKAVRLVELNPAKYLPKASRP